MESYSAINNEIISSEENGWVGNHHIKWNKPASESQILNVFSHMQNPDLKKIKRKRTWM
jgi:hypothetical protein